MFRLRKRTGYFRMHQFLRFLTFEGVAPTTVPAVRLDLALWPHAETEQPDRENSQMTNDRDRPHPLLKRLSDDLVEIPMDQAEFVRVHQRCTPPLQVWIAEATRTCE